MSEKQPITKDFIIDKYIDYLLTHGEPPATVYIFAKKNDFLEKEFYELYGGFSAIDKDIFVRLFESSMSTLLESNEFASYDPKTKLLGFYYTFFENLVANRSYIVSVLDKHSNLKNLEVLSGLKTMFKAFVHSLQIDTMKLPNERLDEFKEKSIAESAWIQFLLTLKFWIDDTSPNFEKTDIYIEKSLSASFELIEITPLKKVVDFGKFIFKEKFHTTK